MAQVNLNRDVARANSLRNNPNDNNPVPPAPPPIPHPNTPESPPVPNEQSTSRLIAFISGLTSVALAVCITVFYFYEYFSGKTDIKIGNLSNILYGLGIGVIPYGFNKISNALK